MATVELPLYFPGSDVRIYAEAPKPAGLASFHRDFTPGGVVLHNDSNGSCLYVAILAAIAAGAPVFAGAALFTNVKTHDDRRDGMRGAAYALRFFHIAYMVQTLARNGAPLPESLRTGRFSRVMATDVQSWLEMFAGGRARDDLPRLFDTSYSVPLATLPWLGPIVNAAFQNGLLDTPKRRARFARRELGGAHLPATPSDAPHNAIDLFSGCAPLPLSFSLLEVAGDSAPARVVNASTWGAPRGWPIVLVWHASERHFSTWLPPQVVAARGAWAISHAPSAASSFVGAVAATDDDATDHVATRTRPS